MPHGFRTIRPPRQIRQPDRTFVAVYERSGVVWMSSPGNLVNVQRELLAKFDGMEHYAIHEVLGRGLNGTAVFQTLHYNCHRCQRLQPSR